MCRKVIALVLAIILGIIPLAMLLSIEVRGNEVVTEQVTSETTVVTEETIPTETTEVLESIQEETNATEETITEETEEVIETEDVRDPISIPVVEFTDIECQVWESLDCDTSSELEMLACVIYQEAGSSSTCDMCRYRVADVVLNRIEHEKFPNNMYDVLTARKQYGRFYWTGIRWADRALSPNEKDAVYRAYYVARDILEGNHSDLYGEGYIWQAEFVQGSSGFWCCDTYFGK